LAAVLDDGLRSSCYTRQEMNLYIARKAQDALKALASGDSREERLKLARMQLMQASSNYHKSSATEHVREYLEKIEAITEDQSLEEVSALIRETIETVFEEYGRILP
jgi:hypothetical protein